MKKEGLQDPEHENVYFSSRIISLFTGETGLLHWQQRKQYRKRREDFLKSSFNSQLRRELYNPSQPIQPDPNITDGEYEIIEPRQLSEPQSPDQE